MYEIIMLSAFFYAATCLFLPEAKPDDEIDLPRKKNTGGKAHEQTEESVSRQKMYHNKPDRHCSRTPALHMQYDRLRHAPAHAGGTRLKPRF